jgi:hypothetical protein
MKIANITEEPSVKTRAVKKSPVKKVDVLDDTVAAGKE